MEDVEEVKDILINHIKIVSEEVTAPTLIHQVITE